MTKDEALKLSMEAMEITGGFDVEINAIKEALAQQEQEPVVVGRWPSAAIGKETLQDAIERERAVGYREGHRAALSQRTWVGLTDEDIKPFCDANHIIFGAYTIDFVRAIEAKLKEKNT